MSEARGNPVRVGVLGMGAVAQIVHLPILAERHDVEVVAVSDLDDHRARTLAERFGVPRVLGDEALVEDPDIDAVVICTPNHLHAGQARAALDAGKHVLCERPLALTAKEAGKLVERARKRSRLLTVNMSHRFRPDVAALRSFVAGGELGTVYAARGSWLNRKLPLNRTTWRQRMEESGGGALMDVGVPALDLLLWLVGYPEIERVTAVLAMGDWEVEDAATVTAVTAEGTVLSVEATWSYFGGEDRHFFRILGSDGSGSLPPLEVYKQLGGRPLEVTPRQPVPRGGENPWTNAYRREIDQFIRALGGQADVALPEEQVRLMALVEAAYRSAKSGKEVRL